MNIVESTQKHIEAYTLPLPDENWYIDSGSIPGEWYSTDINILNPGKINMFIRKNIILQEDCGKILHIRRNWDGCANFSDGCILYEVNNDDLIVIDNPAQYTLSNPLKLIGIKNYCVKFPIGREAFYTSCLIFGA